MLHRKFRHYTTDPFALQRLAFPDNLDAPARFFEFTDVALVPLDIGGELPVPKHGVRFRRRRSPTIFVAVPKAAMHEHDQPPPGEHEVRTSREVAAPEPKTHACCVCSAANGQFRACVLLTNSSHQRRSRRIRGLHAGGSKISLELDSDLCYESLRRSCDLTNRGHVSLFAGIGGFELAFASAGYRTLLTCELDPIAAAVLKSSFPEATLAGDIRALKRIPGCDVVTAGFPCQDLSQAGRTAGIQGENSRLVDEVFRLVDAAARKPRWIVLENVPFMLDLDGGSGMEALVARCEARGWKWAYRVLDARAFGLPQRRRRVVFVASPTEDPEARLLGLDRGMPRQETRADAAHGFYWTEGNRGHGLAADCTPPLKGSSGLGIPSPPAIWFPRSMRVVTPTIETCERLQGFPPGWTAPANDCLGGDRQRWRLVGNAVPVPMFEWLAKRLEATAAAVSTRRSENLVSGERWPTAAFGDGSGRRRRVDVSEWPVRWKRPTLAAFVGGAVRPLSARAAKGFRDRLMDSDLRYPSELLDALDERLPARQRRRRSRRSDVAAALR